MLEGFPRTGDEAEFMCNAGLFPDSAIILALEDTDVIARLLPPRLERWKNRRAKVLEKKEKRKQLIQKNKVSWIDIVIIVSRFCWIHYWLLIYCLVTCPIWLDKTNGQKRLITVLLAV